MRAKTSVGVLLMTVALSAGSLSTLAASQVPEPDYVGNIVLVRADGGIKLEKQRAANHARSGFFKARSSNIVQGAVSEVRAQRGERLKFIVRHSGNDVDPSQVVNVFQLTSDGKRDYRYIETGSAGMFTGDSMKIDFIAFESERYGESSYLLTLSRPLEPGEYAMTLDGSRDVFNLFGVD